jgi:hypothetical protein
MRIYKLFRGSEMREYFRAKAEIVTEQEQKQTGHRYRLLNH